MFESKKKSNFIIVHMKKFNAALVCTFISIFIKVAFSLDSYLLSLDWLHLNSPWERPLLFSALLLLSLQNQAETSG